MPWWNKSSKNKGRNSLPDLFRSKGSLGSPSPSPTKLRRNSNDDLARRIAEFGFGDSPSPFPSPSAQAPRRSVDQFAAQRLPLPQTPTESTACNSPSSHVNGNCKGSNYPYYDLCRLLPLPSPNQILSKEEGDEFLGYGVDSLSSESSVDSVEAVTSRVSRQYNNVDLCKGHSSNGDRHCNSAGNCASNFDNVGRNMPKHDLKQQSAHTFQDNKVSGSQPIKISKKEQRDGNNTFILEAKSAPTTGFSSPIHSPRRLSNVEFPFVENVDATLGHELVISSSNILQGWNSTAEFQSQFSSNKGKASPERFPQSSPKARSPGPRSRIHSGTASPLHPKLASDISAGWRNENSVVSVHPLPLPPGRPISFGASPLSPNSPSTGALRSPGRLETSVTPGQWKKGKRLGSGTFGTVYEGFNRETGDMCAIKEVPLIPDDSQSCESIKQLGQEINLLSQLKHHNIVQYYGSETLEDRLYIYLELVPGGSIYKILREYGPLQEPVIRIYTRQILSGLAYLHSTNTVHRDIKGANLLVDTSGRVKLADFGMAKHISGPACPRSFKGSPYWMAPEIMTQGSPGHDLAVDIWSLGCTIIEMATGRPPWSEYEGAAAMFKVFKNEVPPIPDCLSLEGRDFVRCCLRRNPAERATAFKLLDHLFVRDTSHHENSDLLTSATAAIKSLGTKEKNIYSSAAMTSSGIHSGNGKLQQLPSGSAHSQIGTFIPSSNAPLTPCSTLESHSLFPSRSSTTLPPVPLSGNASSRYVTSTCGVNEVHLNLSVLPNTRNGGVAISQMVDRSEACSNSNLCSPGPMFHRAEVSPLRRNCRSDDITLKNLGSPSQDSDNNRRHYIQGMAPEIPSQQLSKRASYPNPYS
ncbi:mitogen-activated protein kinase kinase kinase 5 isoform X2 [Cryptomeria japonica]|uniref:mitogen-activated protein kinase kinase kinase 5 isoform X2 n=1 Tax=Cryptomeria japonica TaxID=3369 RepID=UPI0027DA3E47|nr:mitogen-activated protein kinase kinase kinase 5 isoform X2 [Cryptomeria japonica]XP_059068000.1 mitogen-activated protein kinase kinase kinase 5 isoform X2 [Cryptomeria japonica]